jgi:two-component system, oxyanion-binding sensor
MLLSEPRYVGVPADVLQRALEGRLPFRQGTAPVHRPDFLVFSRQEAALPRPEHAAWFHAQMVRWGQIPADAAGLAIATSVYRPDLYWQALATAPATRG